MSFDPHYLFAPDKSVSQAVALYGKGCLAAQERLHDLASGLTKTVAEWERDGRMLTLPELGRRAGDGGSDFAGLLQGRGPAVSSHPGGWAQLSCYRSASLPDTQGLATAGGACARRCSIISAAFVQ